MIRFNPQNHIPEKYASQLVTVALLFTILAYISMINKVIPCGYFFVK